MMLLKEHRHSLHRCNSQGPLPGNEGAMEGEQTCLGAVRQRHLAQEQAAGESIAGSRQQLSYGHPCAAESP